MDARARKRHLEDIPLQRPMRSSARGQDFGSVMEFSLYPEVPSCLSQTSFWSVDYLCHSGWLEHAPFAFWLTGAMRPRRFVELGTHAGYSYFAFCQAFDKLAIDGSAYAVDSWAGDEHAGFYTEEIFKTVFDHNQKHFSRFSTLIRSTFDDALSYFADGSIDLLHVDGRHFYEDIKHDFESWEPKLAPRAIVIFHDINVRERDFGVWKFFGELAADRPSFSFLHGKGLGVLSVDGNPPDRLVPLLFASSDAQQQIRSIYGQLGAGLTSRHAFESRRDAVVRIITAAPHFGAGFRDNLARSSNGDAQALQLFDLLGGHLRDSTQQQAILTEMLTRERAEHAATLTAERAEHAAAMAAKRAAMIQESRRLRQALSTARTNAAREQKRLADERDSLTRQLAAAHDRINELGLGIAAMRASTSWRLTAPLRLAVNTLRGGGQINPPASATDTLTPATEPEERFARHAAVSASYGVWSQEFDTPSADDLAHLAETASDVPSAVVLLIFTPATIGEARRVIDALRHCIGLDFAVAPACPGCTSDASTSVLSLLREADISLADLAAIDPGTKLILLDGAAIPRSHGSRVLVGTLAAHPGAEIVYSDEDTLDARGLPSEPWFKPVFSPHLAAAGMLLGRMVALSGNIAQTILAQLRTGSADVAATLRVAALSMDDKKIVHVPHVLFHNLEPRPSLLPVAPPKLDHFPTVSIIIPTRNGWNFLGPCLESIEKSDWPRNKLEIIVVDNGSDDPLTLDSLKSLETSGKITVIRDPRPFNYARLNNVAARIARGEFLVLLNNDVVIRDPAWLHALIAEASAAGTGVVGVKLLYPDDTVQHGGVVLGIQGCAGHAHHMLAMDDGGYMGLANITHEVAALTGACIALRRDLFLAVGGLNEDFGVAFNDVVLCLDIYKKGLRNIYVGRPLITHYESKTRGFDVTPEKRLTWHKETRLAWDHHGELLRDDPFYSPNLSLESPYRLAFAPRRRVPWQMPHADGLRVLMLSSTYARGHGVAVVIEQQVAALIRVGHEVILAGYRSPRDFDFAGRDVIEVHDVRDAATLACQLAVDVIVAHTPPFFSITRWTGAYPPTIVYDYGEPPPDLFPDAQARRAVQMEKELVFSMATRILAISDAVAADSVPPPDAVAPLANSHLGQWTPEAAGRRHAARAARGWEDSFVVLNVCRFHAGERIYKGVDSYAYIASHLSQIDPDLALKTVFVLCGKGDAEDVAEMEQRGLTVAANVSDEEMGDLYAAADAYANFSLWEGYNLGIGQALAMGLPVVASDIMAHRAFKVTVVTDADQGRDLLFDHHRNAMPARVGR
jgi:GT2 family glycosyltransferase